MIRDFTFGFAFMAGAMAASMAGVLILVLCEVIANAVRSALSTKGAGRAAERILICIEDYRTQGSFRTQSRSTLYTSSHTSLSGLRSIASVGRNSGRPRLPRDCA